LKLLNRWSSFAMLTVMQLACPVNLILHLLMCCKLIYACVLKQREEMLLLCACLKSPTHAWLRVITRSFACCMQVYFPDHPSITAQLSGFTGLPPHVSAFLLLGGIISIVVLGTFWPTPPHQSLEVYTIVSCLHAVERMACFFGF